MMMKVVIIVLHIEIDLKSWKKESIDTICSLKFSWVVIHKFSYFSFLISTFLYYRCLICSILSKENSSILMKKQQIHFESVMFSNYNN